MTKPHIEPSTSSVPLMEQTQRNTLMCWDFEFKGARADVEREIREEKRIDITARAVILHTMRMMVGTHFVVATSGYGPGLSATTHSHQLTISTYGVGT
jgi:hypothetical protein